MTGNPVNLNDLLLDFSGLTDEEAMVQGEDLYFREFISRNNRSGSIIAHDGEVVIFYGDRYHHAFHTSHDRARNPYSKAKVARDRIERLNWIRPIVEGKVANTECWDVPLDSPRPFPGKRLYICWEEGYIIWLEPRTAGGFRFSSAYGGLSGGEISRYTRCSRKIWSFT
jgi:hypothetical protein